MSFHVANKTAVASAKALESGRAAFEDRRWREAHEYLSQASAGSALEPTDLELLACAAYLAGREADATNAWTEAHHLFIERGQPKRAARCGFWLSLSLLLSGDGARSAGWLARTQRGLKQHPDCAEHGLTQIIAGLLQMGREPEKAADAFEEAVTLAERHGDADLLAFGLLGRGQVLIQMRKVPEGIPSLDEAMVTVMSGAGADELAKVAAETDVPFLVAAAAEATGSVLLAEGDARAALAALREA